MRLEAVDAKSEPNLQVLSVIRSVDLICHLWQQYVSTVLLPLASSSVTVRREMVTYNNQCINRIESSSNQLLQRLIDGTSRIELECKSRLILSCSHYNLLGSAAQEAKA